MAREASVVFWRFDLHSNVIRRVTSFQLHLNTVAIIRHSKLKQNAISPHASGCAKRYIQRKHLSASISIPTKNLAWLPSTRYLALQPDPRADFIQQTRSFELRKQPIQRLWFAKVKRGKWRALAVFTTFKASCQHVCLIRWHQISQQTRRCECLPQTVYIGWF